MGIYKSGRPTSYQPHEDKGTKPPQKAGEYRVRDNDKNMLYVGETNNLPVRMKQHMKAGKIKDGYSFEWKVADGRSSSRTRREHERQKIKQHNPPLNKSKGGEGRIAGKKSS